VSSRSKNLVLIGVFLVAAGLAAALIAVSVTGGGDDSSSTVVEGVPETQALLEGIPQRGNVLGKPNAPVTIVEYADFQCPACQAWALDTLPTIVDEYVRTGKARIVFNGVAFLGPDSEVALRTAAAAGRQGKLWNVAELLFHNQGDENSGWVTDDLLRSIGEAAGVDAERMLDDRQSAEVTSALAEAQLNAQAAGLSLGPTPSFEVGRTGGESTQLQGVVPADDFRRLLDELLQQP
jgi:protein-disulfide isomerase